MKDLAKLRKRNLEMKIEDFYSKVLSRLGIVPSDEILESIWMIYCGSYSFFEKKGARETLETLYGRFKLAIVSNSMSGVPRLFLEKCDLIKYFDVVVISRDVGFRKPDPRIFNYALRELNVKPSEAVHVGDLLREDIFGAKNVGMKAIWVCNGKSLGKEDILPDLIANSIADVPKLVDMLNEILSSNSSSFLL
jgi:HAD superfamily hydrolase (TIGR01549 family)